MAKIILSFLISLQKLKQTKVPSFVYEIFDEATTATGPGCGEGTDLRLRDFAVVPLMPARDYCHFGNNLFIYLFIYLFITFLFIYLLRFVFSEEE